MIQVKYFQKHERIFRGKDTFFDKHYTNIAGIEKEINDFLKKENITKVHDIKFSNTSAGFHSPTKDGDREYFAVSALLIYEVD